MQDEVRIKSNKQMIQNRFNKQITKSRLNKQIIKNRFRSTSSDERLDSIMIITSESDILQLISTVLIIDNFAMSSEIPQKLLFPISVKDLKLPSK